MSAQFAWSKLTVTKSVETDDKRILEGVASTPSTDRAGDIVESLGAEYELPIPFLSQHNAREPIGFVTSAKVAKDGITVTIEIAKDTGLDYIETAWKQIKAGLVRGLSVGFAPIEYNFMKDGGVHFLKWAWLELSAVTIPANADASIASIKSFDRAAALLGGAALPPPGLPSVPANRKTKGQIMTIAERIQAAQAGLVQLKDALKVAIEKQDDSNPNADLGAEIKELNDAIDAREANLDQLKASESRVAAALGVPITRGGGGLIERPASPAVARLKKSRDSEDPANFLFKAGVVKLLAHVNKMDPLQVLRDRYADEVEVEAVVKATSAIATTTASTWAASLVQTAQGAFLDLLTPLAAYPKLAALGGKLEFGPNSGNIRIPYRNDTASAAGDVRAAFVAEGEPIPVRQASIGSVTFTPKKMGVISTFSREIAKYSNPSIEGLLRQFILRDTAIGIDTALLDAVASSTARPPGLRNGVTPTAGAGGATLANVITDLTTALASFTLAVEGRRLVWIMNPTQALFLSLLLTSTGTFMFPTVTQAGGTLLGLPVIVSSRMPNHALGLVDAQAFFTATGDNPEWEVSDQATLHMDDGGYAADQTATAGTTTVLPLVTDDDPDAISAYPVRSLFQTASLGLRMILDMDWGLVRSGSVAVVTTTW